MPSTGDRPKATPIMASKPKAKLLTTEEACLFLWDEFNQKTKVRLYRANKAGRLQSVQMTGRHWWRLSDLEKFCAVEPDCEAFA